ncbi:MAG: hypothetical protein ACON4N_17305 [Myxococcota bacterium]
MSGKNREIDLDALTALPSEEERAAMDAELDNDVLAMLSGSMEDDATLRARHGDDVVDAHMPLSDDYINRTTARVMGMMPAQPAPLALSDAPVDEVTSSWSWRTLAMPMLALAFVGLLVPRVLVPTSQTLPSYDVVVVAGDKLQRNDEAQVAPLSEGSAWTIELRVEEAVEGTVAAAVFLRRDDGWQPLPADIRVAPTGAVRVSGLASPALLGAGASANIRVVVVPGEEPPATAVSEGFTTDVSLPLAWGS